MVLQVHHQILVVDFIQAQQALMCGYANKAVQCQGLAGALDLLYAWAEGAENAVRPEALAGRCNCLRAARSNVMPSTALIENRLPSLAGELCQGTSNGRPDAAEI
jgi:hypothetical protein